MSQKFTCPYCHKPTTATEPHVYNEEYLISLESDSDLGKVYLVVNAISCPNSDCNKLFLQAFLANKIPMPGTGQSRYMIKHEWQLLPDSTAKVLPEYVPNQIKNDYLEACKIRDLSPKASATLARRCLQGIIRDFWKISKERLIDEIKSLEEKIDPLTWEAIDSVRKVGNIGAHMEKDINVIIDVDANEAQLLLELIEQLVDDWYIARRQKEERLQKIKTVAETKDEQKKTK